jgi:hypothetical protein
MTNLFGTLGSSLVAARGASGAFSRSLFVVARGITREGLHKKLRGFGL